MRETNSKPFILLEGNSIMYSAAINSLIAPALNNYFGAGTYDIDSKAVSGEDIDDMQARINPSLNTIGGLRSNNYVIFLEIRNQIGTAGSSAVATFSKLKTYAQSYHNMSDKWTTVCVTAPASYNNGNTAELTDINVVNQSVRDDVSGDFDLVIDLYNYSTFDDPNSALFQTDRIHPTVPAGIGSMCDFIAFELWTYHNL